MKGKKLPPTRVKFLLAKLEQQKINLVWPKYGNNGDLL